MFDRWKNRILVILLAAFFGMMLLIGLLRSPDEVSVPERRKLAKLPTLTWSGVWNGSFARELDAYALDQLPFREPLRTLKATLQFQLLQRRDNNGIYLVDGAVYKLETPDNAASHRNVAEKTEALYRQYLAGTDCNAFFAVIPDKNYYTAAQHGYPSLDYGALMTAVDEGTPHFQKIDLTDCLGADTYYRTDTHWRQEALSAVTERLAEQLDIILPPLSTYTEKTVYPFYGVYYGQSALSLEPDKLTVLESDALARCTVTNYETGQTTGVYDWGKLGGMDAYDVFLSGACPLLTIDNPSAKTERELVIFRDSFGSSLAPLLAPAYRRITLVDTRYMSGALLGDYVTFVDQDVLFLYSTVLINNSATIK